MDRRCFAGVGALLAIAVSFAAGCEVAEGRTGGLLEPQQGVLAGPAGERDEGMDHAAHHEMRDHGEHHEGSEHHEGMDHAAHHERWDHGEDHEMPDHATHHEMRDHGEHHGGDAR